MDRIDHYPQVQTNDDLHAGRVAGEIKALRDQQENFYYRDQILNSEPISAKSKKAKKSKESISDIPIIRSNELTRICVDDHNRRNEIDSTDSQTPTNDILALIFVLVGITSFVFLIAKILETLFS
jgi:hypothetical protein